MANEPIYDELEELKESGEKKEEKKTILQKVWFAISGISQLVYFLYLVGFSSVLVVALAFSFLEDTSRYSPAGRFREGVAETYQVSALFSLAAVTIYWVINGYLSRNKKPSASNAGGTETKIPSDYKKAKKFYDWFSIFSYISMTFAVPYYFIKQPNGADSALSIGLWGILGSVAFLVVLIVRYIIEDRKETKEKQSEIIEIGSPEDLD